MQRFVVDEYITCLNTETTTTTPFARLLTYVFGDLLPYRKRLGVLIAPFHVWNDALKRVFAAILEATIIRIGKSDGFVATTVENNIADPLG